jgi:exonuclease VII large subunit
MLNFPSKSIDNKIKISFSFIRKDLEQMQKKIEAMRKYLKKKDKEYQNQNQQTIKIQNQIQENIDNFTQKFIQLKLAISQINAIKQEVVIKKNLAQIEERIKISFANEIKKYKKKTNNIKEKLKESQNRIKALEKGTKYESKKFWFLKN